MALEQHMEIGDVCADRLNFDTFDLRQELRSNQYFCLLRRGIRQLGLNQHPVLRRNHKIAFWQPAAKCTRANTDRRKVWMIVQFLST